MGFSVSGSAAIIFASLFIAFGLWTTASANSFERVSEAEADRTDGLLTQQNTAIEITSATWNGTHLIVDAENAGAAQLRLSETDFLVDGAYRTDWQADATAGGDAETDLWLSGETLTITRQVDAQPDRVKLVASSAVADTAEVTAT